MGGERKGRLLVNLFTPDQSGSWAGTELVVREIVPISRIDEEDLLRLAARAVWPAGHPIGEALRQAAADRAMDCSAPAESDTQHWEFTGGMGLQGRMGSVRVFIGNEALIKHAGIVLSDSAETIIDCHRRDGWIPLLIGAANQAADPHEARCSLLGVIGLSTPESEEDAFDDELGRLLAGESARLLEEPTKTDQAPPVGDGRVPRSAATVGELDNLLHKTAGTSPPPPEAELAAQAVEQPSPRMPVECREAFQPLEKPLPAAWRKWRVPALLVAISALAGLASSLVIIGPGQAAVVQRFGRHTRVLSPGIHLRAWPFERVIRLKPHEPRTIRIIVDGAMAEPALTGDLLAPDMLGATGESGSAPCLVSFDLAVQFVISDPSKYLMHVPRLNDLLTALAESVLREQIGYRELAELPAEGRVEIAGACSELLKREVSALGLGVEIQEVTLNSLAAETGRPQANESAGLESLTEARSQLLTALAQARAKSESIVEQARVQANERVAAAEQARRQAIADAVTQAKRVGQIAEQFRRDPQATRRKLLADLIESRGRSGRIVVFDSHTGRTRTLPAPSSSPSPQTRPAGSEGHP